MSVSLGPWDPQYPVNFYESGDTVTQAFGKHIQEIERIYGLLNALDADKVSGAELAEILRSYVTLTYLNTKLGEYVTNTAFSNHVNSGDPHPNLMLSTLRGSLGFDRITGNVPANRINGLENAIRNIIGDNQSGGGGVEVGNGYAKIGGLVFQWGSVDVNFSGSGATDYSIPQKTTSNSDMCILAKAFWPSHVGIEVFTFPNRIHIKFDATQSMDSSVNFTGHWAFVAGAE